MSTRSRTASKPTLLLARTPAVLCLLGALAATGACGGSDGDDGDGATPCMADGNCYAACAADPDCAPGTGGAGATGGASASGGGPGTGGVAGCAGQRYLADGEIVIDCETQLSWVRASDWPLQTWSAAGEACSELTLGGLEGWRLPTQAELLTILTAPEGGGGDYAGTGCYWDAEAFLPGARCGEGESPWYWTSDRVGEEVRIVLFASLGVTWDSHSGSCNDTNVNDVRCVSDGADASTGGAGTGGAAPTTGGAAGTCTDGCQVGAVCCGGALCGGDCVGTPCCT